MSGYTDIIARLQAATGPNYALEKDIDKACMDDGANRPMVPPNYTASLDAAISLVERMLPGWRKSTVENAHHGSRHCHVYRAVGGDLEDYSGDHAKSSPIALLLAMFRALEAKEAQS